MQNSKGILDRLTLIAATSSSNEKVALLKEAIEQSPLFEKAIIYALDPMFVFNIKDLSFLDEVVEHNEGRTLSSDGLESGTTLAFFKVLDMVRSRYVTGQSAKVALKGLVRDYDSATSDLLRLILNKDVRAGIGVSLVNKAVPGTLFEFRVMLASKWEPEKISYPVRVEPKYDGMRLLAIGDANKFTFYTRTGKIVTTVPFNIQEALISVYEDGTDVWKPSGNMVFDGELMGDSFKDTMEQARRKDHEFKGATFYVFDAMTGKQFQKLQSPRTKHKNYQERRADLKAVIKDNDSYFGIKVPPSYIVKNEEELLQIYASVRDRGLEGLIIKNPKGKYHPRRHRDWMKLKDSNSVDVPIIGAVEGTGKYEGALGAFVVDVEGVTVNVGTGFSDQQRLEYWGLWQAGWLKEKIAEVEYHERTPDGSLRHPRFKCFRSDKTIEDGIGC